MIRFAGFWILLALAVSVISCSKSRPSEGRKGSITFPESFPIANSVMKNCHFKDPEPTYSYGASIPPNPILCDEGVARVVTLLSPNPLPGGLSFSSAQLSLVGTASEKVSSAPYEFYAENEAGYIILKMRITVK